MPRPLALLAACLLAAHAAAQNEPDPRRTLPVDPVLLTQGRDVPGDGALSATHGVFTYHFASEQTREQFLADPARYEIQLNGACARMGPLSSGGDARRYAVHDNRIYIFASESCRQTFLTHADQLIERDDRPLLPADCEAQDGRALVDAAIAWIGGPEALDAVRTYSESLDAIHTDARDSYPHQVALDIEFDEQGRPRRARETDDWHSYGLWGNILLDGRALAVSRQAAEAPLAFAPLVHDQRRSLERTIDRSLIAILKAAAAPDANLCLIARARVGEVDAHDVAIHARGVTATLSIEPTTGRILALAHTARGGPHALLGTRRLIFTRFERVGGLSLPIAADAFFEGEPEPAGCFDNKRIRINQPLDPAWFEVPDRGA